MVRPVGKFIERAIDRGEPPVLRDGEQNRFSHEDPCVDINTDPGDV